jgi:hypothetical protein
MLSREKELSQICKSIIETYEMLRKYKSMMFMVLPPQEQWKFIQCENLYPRAKEIISEIEKEK